MPSFLFRFHEAKTPHPCARADMGSLTCKELNLENSNMGAS
jgi:hypothetical protein